MNKIERAKKRVNKLEIRLGVLKEKRRELLPVLSQFECESIKDVKTTVKRLRKEREKINGEIVELADSLDSALEKIEEDLDD